MTNLPPTTPRITDRGTIPSRHFIRLPGSGKGECFPRFSERPNFRFPRDVWTVTSTLHYLESLQEEAFRLLLPGLKP